MIPYGRQLVTDEDVAAVVDVLRGDFLTTGPMTARFEDGLAGLTRAAHAVVCSSGTAALHLAMLALGIGPGDAVLVPDLTFVADANCARHVGAEVVLADVDPETALLTAETMEAAIETHNGRPLKAVIVVHINGQSADMAGIRGVADQYGLRIVEDACHALGAYSVSGHGRAPVGACDFSDLTCFSFHPVKTITMGEGGAVTSHCEELAERLRCFRDHGIRRDPKTFQLDAAAFTKDGMPSPWYYEAQELGCNYRASDIHCALGYSQLQRLDTMVAARARIASLYDTAFADQRHVTPVPRAHPDQDGWHLYPVLIDFDGLGHSRASVMTELRDRGFGTQVHYIPISHHPLYRRAARPERLKGTYRYYARCLSLPLFPALTDTDVDCIAAALLESIA